MTTREYYFKYKMATNLPVELIFYILKNEKDIIGFYQQVINYKEEDEDNINKMKEIERKPGFMFWGNSSEGEKFIHDNWKEISEVLKTTILNQK